MKSIFDIHASRGCYLRFDLTVRASSRDFNRLRHRIPIFFAGGLCVSSLILIGSADGQSQTRSTLTTFWQRSITLLASIPRPNIATRSITREDLLNTVARLWGCFNSSGRVGKAIITNCRADASRQLGLESTFRPRGRPKKAIDDGNS